MGKTEYEVPTIEDIFFQSLDVARKILKNGDRYDVIVGISRGGLIPTRLLSDFLDIKDIRIIKSIYYTGTGERLDKPRIDLSTLGDIKDKAILLVDDVADTGDTLALIREKLLNLGAKKVDIATLYVKPWRRIDVKYYSLETDRWIVFPWEIKEVVMDLKRKGVEKELLEIVRDRRDFKEVLTILNDC